MENQQRDKYFNNIEKERNNKIKKHQNTNKTKIYLLSRTNNTNG